MVKPIHVAQAIFLAQKGRPPRFSLVNFPFAWPPMFEAICVSVTLSTEFRSKKSKHFSHLQP